MNIKQLREQINAAWDAGDKATAERLQSKLHKHYTADADAFFTSTEGAQWLDRMTQHA